jgi:hypothetical protein
MLALLTVTSHLGLRDHPVASHAAIAYFLFICARPYWMLYDCWQHDKRLTRKMRLSLSLAASFGTNLNASDHVIVANRRNDGLLLRNPLITTYLKMRQLRVPDSCGRHLRSELPSQLTQFSQKMQGDTEFSEESGTLSKTVKSRQIQVRADVIGHPFHQIWSVIGAEGLNIYIA